MAYACRLKNPDAAVGGSLEAIAARGTPKTFLVWPTNGSISQPFRLKFGKYPTEKVYMPSETEGQGKEAFTWTRIFVHPLASP
ncbi:MAG: hypothetical protein LZF60_160071 [Nitrospira sp.]|nr:MAG: hypothetical protein LZF60_160071 [Nitrospira sp.]